MRVYIIEYTPDLLSDEEFMSLAEEEGTVYTLKGFEQAFNREEIRPQHQLIRIL